MLHVGRVGCLFTAKKQSSSRAFQGSLSPSLPQLLHLQLNPPVKRGIASPPVALSRVLSFPVQSCKWGKPHSASASAPKKTSRLLITKKCLLNPRPPCNCAVQPVKIKNCLLLVYSACLPLIPHAFLTSSNSVPDFLFSLFHPPTSTPIFLFVRKDLWLRQKHGT